MGSMKRAVLICLLLTACTKADPAGTLTLQADSKWSKVPAVILENATQGDTPPMRLPSGDYAVTVLQPERAPVDCRYSLTFTPYGKTGGRVLMQDTRVAIFERIRMNAIQGGLYALTVRYSDPLCMPDVMVEHLT